MHKYKRLTILLSGTILMAATAGAQELTISSDDSISTDDCSLPLKAGSAIEYVTNSSIRAEIADDPAGCLQQGSKGEISPVLLNVDPYNEIDSGTVVTLTWAAPTGHQCSITKNGSPLVANSGVHSRTTQTDEPTTDTAYRLSCSLTKTAETNTAPGEVVSYATAALTVKDSGGGGEAGGECAQRVNGFTRVDTVTLQPTGSASNYDEMFGQWGASSNGVHMKMAPNKYVSFQFSTSGSPDMAASILWEQVNKNPDFVATTVSSCFGPPIEANALPQVDSGDSCYKLGIGSNGLLSMKLDGAQQPSVKECVLQPNTTYYLNVAFMDAEGNRACNEADHCVWAVKEN